MMQNLAVPRLLFKIVENPSQNIYLHCGKPPKMKKLEDNIGKPLEISGKTAIITYPLNFLLDKGESYQLRFYYSLEIIKNVLLEKTVWKYENGRIKES